MNDNSLLIGLSIINRDLPFIVSTVAVSVADLDSTIYMVILCANYIMAITIE